MSKMKKIALVGLLATQGCYLPTEQGRADRLENDLQGYCLISAHPGQPAQGANSGRPAYVQVRKGTERWSRSQHSELTILDENLDGWIDNILWDRPGGPTKNSERWQIMIRASKMKPKIRAVYQKTYSNHQASQRNYKGGKR